MMHKQVIDLMLSWRGVFGHYKNQVVWQATPHCIMWTIWRGTYRRTFEDEEKS